MNQQQRAVVQQALEAMGNITNYERLEKARAALRQLLEAEPVQEPVQEPVAWMHVDAYQPSNRHLEWKENCKGYLGDWIKHPLYTAPPAHPSAWVGLTIDELLDLEGKHRSHEDLSAAIKAKLKEKNT